jgi:tetratricopeptide (TPR) repeat protein
MMDTPTPSLREQGIQALRAGNLDGAIDLLARAAMADGQDAEAQAFLGVAYSQKGQHDLAQRALQAAIAMQPQEARYPFNLGVAREQAGDATGAVQAYREALRLNPAHAQAKARLQAMEARAAASSAATPATGGSTPWLGQQPPGVAPTAPAAPAAPTAPWLAGQQAPGATAGGPTGTVQCPSCKQWSRPGMSCEWCSASLGRPPASTYGASPEAARSADYEALRPASVILVVVLECIGAVIVLLAGIMVMLGGGAIGAALGAQAGPAGAPMFGAIMAGVGIVFIVIALVHFMLSYFLWVGKNWARITLTVLTALSMLGNLLQAANSRSPIVPVLSLVFSAALLILLNIPATKEFCTN